MHCKNRMQKGNVKLLSKKVMQKCLYILCTCYTFAPTVLTTLPVRTASQGESFAFIYFSKIMHLPGLNSKLGRFFYAIN